MKNWGMTFSLLLLPFLVLISMPLLASGKVQSFVGQVSDAMCGAHHMEPGATPAECTRACVSKGAKYALVVGDKVYTLDGENKAALDELNALAGQKARVKGMLNDDTIKVMSVNITK